VIALPVARDPPATRHISYSAISLYAACPLRYGFKYVMGLPEETIASSLVFGRAAHASFQHHFEQLLIADTAPSHDSLLEVFWDAWHEHDHLRVLFNKGEDENAIGHLADRVLRAFERSAIARPEGRIIAVEEELRGELVPGIPDLLARIDLLIETDDALHLLDLKTARTSWNEDNVARSTGQLLLYSELVKHMADGKPLRLGFAVLTKGKFPDLTVHPVMHDPKQVERTKRIVEKVWRSIECGHFFPSPSPMQCPTCPYREPCRNWMG